MWLRCLPFLADGGYTGMNTAFIDGAAGGYALAAAQLKEQSGIALQPTPVTP